ELSLEGYQSSERKLRAEIQKLERHAEVLTDLISANSATDVGAPTRRLKLPPTEVGMPVKKSVAAAPEPPLPSKAAPLAKAVAPARSGKLSRGRLLGIVGVAVVVIAVIVTVVLLTTSGVKEVSVPIEVKDAANVGSLHLELVYDRDILNAVAVESGTAVGDALFEYNINTPGQLMIGLVSNQGIPQDGSIAIVTFEVIGRSKMSTSLSLENVAAYDAATLAAIPISALTGNVAIKDGSFTPPTLLFQP
ncbi:MAG: hypothetical protein JXB43_00845, partial [Dehalococcoidia bacterium]|nr:hypothetical protein [Dehalococcoidia bacterium]